MKWLNWLDPRRWFKRDITLEQLIKLGLVGSDYAGLGYTAEETRRASAVDSCRSRDLRGPRIAADAA